VELVLVLEVELDREQVLVQEVEDMYQLPTVLLYFHHLFQIKECLRQFRL